MGQHRYNVQQTNGAIATVLLTEEEAAAQGLTAGQRLDREEETPAKPKSRARSGSKPARASSRARASRATAKAVEVQPEDVAAANDTTVAAVEVSADVDPADIDPTTVQDTAQS